MRWLGEVSPAGRGDGGGGVNGGADLYLTPPEKIHTAHYDKDNYGTMSGSREASSVMGGQKLVGAVRLGLGGGGYGSLGGRTGGGGE